MAGLSGEPGASYTSALMPARSKSSAALVSTNKDVVDPRVLPKLLKQVGGPIERVYADGAYDSRECYRAIYINGKHRP